LLRSAIRSHGPLPVADTNPARPAPAQDAGTPTGDAATIDIPHPAAGRTHDLVAVLLLTVGVVIAWTIAGHHLVGAHVQQAFEIAGVLLVGALGLQIATHVSSRSSKMERNYSAHLEDLSQRLRSLAYKDSLTSLHNHRFFHEQLGHEVESANRYSRPVSVILMDLDHFKEVNDTYGHLMGDRLIALVGEVVGSHVRGADIAARYGGDEFAIILPDTSREAAEQTAKKLTKAISAGRMYVGGSAEQSLPLSASYGVASCPDEARSVTELLQLADDRLYAAKDGRLLPQGMILSDKKPEAARAS
jgi:diguanylate cyclase (GGDEF)-like protein